MRALLTIEVKKKKLNFNINYFSKFKDKIEYLVSDKQPTNIEEINDKDTDKEKSKQEIIYIILREALNFETTQLSKKFYDKGALSIREDVRFLERREILFDYREIDVFHLRASKLDIIDIINTFLNYSDEFKTFFNPCGIEFENGLRP